MFEIKLYNDNYKDRIISVWEKSVRATHDFLIPSDIEYYKDIVSNINFNDIKTYCLIFETNVLGFIGINNKKIEMLFLSPEIIGKGYGQKLVTFAIKKFGVNLVDVNEQNIKARAFYEKMGFIVFERTETDSEGKNYPILKMKLNY
ncbi:MAG: GNAT family N-acetyltransferase [Bacteroidales bacterium]|jgi:putative acetyltransferase|nr:GNAT family N-acetyltransferase [Bacteroidales bacterium]